MVAGDLTSRGDHDTILILPKTRSAWLWASNCPTSAPLRQNWF